MSMSIRDRLYGEYPVISFEIFPPKPEYPLEQLVPKIKALSDLNPDFISVTYGAGGSSRGRTVEIASMVQNRFNLPALAHLTCVGSSPQEIQGILEELEQEGITHILSMRGDPREGAPAPEEEAFRYASDLVQFIHASAPGTFTLAGAAYPEGHAECESLEKDIEHLKIKVDQGVDFLITQLFFDNEIFFRFMEKIRHVGISVPVLPGIMPVLQAKQISRIVSLCGASIPPKLARLLARYEGNPEALEEAGIAYATDQIIDLFSWGVPGIHLYTMNKPEVARRILANIGNIRSFPRREEEGAPRRA
jgi:methylenetetrahydrofolate reductase (NADPH)